MPEDNQKMENTQGNDLYLKGIIDGSRAFTGPATVQFDVTNKCNNNCLCCWNNSPLLGELSKEKEEEKQFELPFDLVIRTLTELKEMGTKNIFFAGGGEPFMHPRFMEILECAKSFGMRTFINTNFTLLDEEKVRKMVEMKVDLVHASLLAGNPRSYRLVHPGTCRDTFSRIRKLLRLLADIKEQLNQIVPPVPHVDIYCVMFKTNYRDVRQMVDLALHVKANSIEFTPMDAIPGKTDVLLLESRQKEKMVRHVMAQKKRLDKIAAMKEPPKDYHGTFIEQYDSFIKRMADRNALKGQYETNIVPTMPCYVGWYFVRILANGSVNPCLKAHKISIGNLHNRSFKDIWNSPEQMLFRQKSFSLDREDPYFRAIGNNPNTPFGCLNSCDNIQINKEAHEKYAEILKAQGKIKKTIQ